MTNQTPTVRELLEYERDTHALTRGRDRARTYDRFGFGFTRYVTLLHRALTTREALEFDAELVHRLQRHGLLLRHARHTGTFPTR